MRPHFLRSILIKAFIVFLVMVLLAAGAVFWHRYAILQYSAENIIRKVLPSYITIDSIKFEFAEKKVTVRGLRIASPPHFSYAHLLEIDETTCLYRYRGRTVLDGIEILEPVFRKLTLTLERMPDGRVNITNMGEVIGSGENAPRPPAQAHPASGAPAAFSQKRLSDMITLPEQFSIRDGRMVFIDRYAISRPHTTTLDGIRAVLVMKLDRMYSKVISASSTGQGYVNGSASGSVAWNISIDPSAPRLTMSNRFDVSNVELAPFRPYYDRYSPLVFTQGLFSGTLVFDFYDGNIGSTNEVRLSGLKFSVKPGYESTSFWETSVPEMVKYFTTASGDVVFDFKIKGDMSQPKFFLGPISKQAMASMAIDKISSAIQSASQGVDGTGTVSSTVDKAKQYIELIKSMTKK